MVYKSKVGRKKAVFYKRLRSIGRRKRGCRMFSRPTKRRRLADSKKSFVAKQYRRKFGSVSNMVNTVVPPVKWMVHQFAQTYNIGNESSISKFMHSLVNSDATIMFFRANSPCDADATAGTIHDYSSTMYSYMANHYSRYEVYSSKCTVIFQQRNNSQGSEMDVGFGVKLDDNAGFTGVQYPYELARMDPTWHCKKFHVNGLCAGFGKPTVITHRWSRSNLDTADKASNSSTVGSSPVYSEYYMPTVCKLSQSDTVLGGPDWLVTVRISYLTRWSDRKDIAADATIIPTN